MKINIKNILLGVLFIFMITTLSVPISFTFIFAEENIISSIEITVSQPLVEQEQPRPVVETDYTSLYAYEWYYGDTKLYSFDSFLQGETYTLVARVSTIKQFDNQTVVKVNGNIATIKSVETNTILFSYEFVAKKMVSPITIDGGVMAKKTTPIILELSKINSEVIEFCNTECGCDEQTIALSNKWLDMETYNIVSSFENEKTYIYYLVVHIKTGYILPSQITDDFVKVDGITWTETDCEILSGDLVVFGGKIVYNSATGIPTNKIEIKFDSNGGSGTMDTLLVNKGTTKLPNCTFTAPEGKKFKAWAVGSIDGEQYEPNKEYNVENELTIYAIWEDSSQFDFLQNIELEKIIIIVGILIGIVLCLSIIKKFKVKK